MTWKWSTIGAQQRPRTSIIIIIIIIIRLSVTLVAWWGILVFGGTASRCSF